MNQHETEQGRMAETGKKPVFVETIGPRKMVGILPDGTWAVGWQQPPTQEGIRRIIWHPHEDVWSVLNQNGRVIRAFIGTPLLEDVPEGELKDPNLGPSLVEINTLIIPGENETARLLSRRIENIAAFVQANRITAEDAKRALSEIQRELARARNPHKVAARNNLEVVMDPNVPLDLNSVLGISDDMLARAQEGTQITRALLTRGVEILDWSRRQEAIIGPLKFTIERALKDTSEDTIRPRVRESWDRDFFGDESKLFDALDELNGRPYSLLRDNREIKRLRNGRETLVNGSPLAVQRILGQAYQPFYSLWQQREERNESGKYKIYQK